MISHPFANLRAFQDRLDLRFLTKQDNAATDADIRRVAGIGTAASLHQKHGGAIAIVRGPTSRTEQADGLITDVKGLGLIIRFADCQNFVVYAPRQNVVGLIHAGWRGVVTGVIPKFFETLKREWGIGAKETFIGAGPSLCLKCADFSNPESEVPALRRWINGRNVDLIGAADEQLKAAGAPHGRIERMSDCTRCNPDRYWTYRGGHREEVKNGFTNCFVTTLK